MGNLETKMTTVGELVRQAKTGELQLPEIQREYVWKRPQVRDLLDSLYRGYPVGTLLVWQTAELPIHRVIDSGDTASGDSVNFLLDGQQRLTSLNKVMNEREFDIRFNIETEEFQTANAAIAKDPKWVSVSDVLNKGALKVLMEKEFHLLPTMQEIGDRLARVEAIKSVPVPVNVLKGFGYEEVTEIFVRVNSKGTRLRAAELAVAQLAFRLPGLVTEELKAFSERLDDLGWEIDVRFLLRCLSAVSSGQREYLALSSVPSDEIISNWKKAKISLETFLNHLRNDLGIESTQWLPSLTALVLPVAYLARTPPKQVHVKAMLRWFLLTSAWRRYAFATETALGQDLRVLEQHPANPFPVLIDRIKDITGRLEITAHDLDDAGTNSSFLLMSYLACRNAGATDWWHGTKLSSTNLGRSHLLELHHIIPKALVKDANSRQDVNEIANLAFLSQRANREIGKKLPREYLADIKESRLNAQFVPLDPHLWEVENFQAFLQARRELLAAGMNTVIAGLEE